MSKITKRPPAWALPLLIAAVLAGTSYASFNSLERELRKELESSLVTLRNSAATAIEIWGADKRAEVELLVSTPGVRAGALELLEIARDAPDPREALRLAPAQARLAEDLREPLASVGHLGYGVVSPLGFYAGRHIDRDIGVVNLSLLDNLGRLQNQRSIVTRPIVRDDPGLKMMVATALRDDRGRFVGGFGFSMRADDEFGRILAVARSGETGEAYVFDREGHLLSRSRFEDTLRELDLVDADQRSIVNVLIRDPGGDLTAGYVPGSPAATRPLTVAAAGAIEGGTAANVLGYRDYRGVMVVGAWTWLPELDVGLVVEIDRDEAYAPVYAARRTFQIVLGLLMIGALGLFLYAFAARRLRQEADAARQLGRYQIESRIGKGGMGTVYLARHALLRRPTAVKVLDSERAGKEGIERFKREVQTTSGLRHPNTIEIYDYGETADGTFYYAMEYVPGFTLGAIVEGLGPLTEARVLHILRQAAGSIAEAHAAGLIHRDLKPANVMLCERGGVHDFVKVLDFGLVRSQQQTSDVALTDTSALTGTPMYMPPEAIRAPDTLDARGDVYQLGLIGYFLLTGRAPFSGDTPMDVMMKHVGEPPVSPSERLDHPVSPDLEKLILECLAKNPSERPEDAGVLADRLDRCVVEGEWGESDARRWWAESGALLSVARGTGDPSTGAGSLPSGMDIAERTPVS